MELHLITSKHLQLHHAQAWSCIWSRANISSYITSKLELHLITSKHLQLDHAQAWSCIWSRANISILITRKHGVTFDYMQKSPTRLACIFVTPVSAVTQMQFLVGLPQANRLQRCHASWCLTLYINGWWAMYTIIPAHGVWNVDRVIDNVLWYG